VLIFYSKEVLIVKYIVLLLALAVVFATFAGAAEERWRNSNGSYGAYTSFGGTYHPGTLFIPGSGKYPVFLKKAHFGFNSGSVSVQVKIWSATGSTIGSVLASYPATTSGWPTWTDVDVSSGNHVFPSNNFFISTNNPQMGPLGSSFRGAYPQTYSGYHYWSADDQSWRAWTTTDWAIECTVDTNYTGIAPASLGRVKALYR
jgi:hypothetical protein